MGWMPICMHKTMVIVKTDIPVDKYSIKFAQSTAMKKCSFTGVLAFRYPVEKHPADEPVASPSLWCYHSSYPDDVKRMAVS